MEEQRETLLGEFIQRSISSAEERLKRFVVGPDGERYPKRFMFQGLADKIDAFRVGDVSIRWMVLAGLRGMGKTTMLAQSYQYLLDSEVPRNRILFLSVEDSIRKLNAPIDELITAYEKVIGRTMESLKDDEKTFIFLDEAHYDPNWDGALKSVYERSNNVFIMVTGSSALALTRGPDAARRALVRHVPSLSFTEHLMLSRGTVVDGALRTTMTDAIMYSASAEECYGRLNELRARISERMSNVDHFQLQEYLQTGTIAFSVGMNDRFAFYDLIASTLDRIISIDLPTVKNITPVNQTKAMNLLTFMALSDRMSLESMTRNLDISKTGLLDILSALEASDVIYRVRPFGSESTRMRKTPKYKFTAPAMRATILHKVGRSVGDPEILGWLMEDAVSMYLREMSRDRMGMRFDYDHKEGGADFIVQWADLDPVIIEVGYGKKGGEQVERTARKVKPRYSLLVSEGDLHLDLERRYVRVPKEWFLMMR